MSNNPECTNPRDKAHKEDLEALQELERRPWLIIIASIALLLALGAVVFNVVNHSETTDVKTATSHAQQAADSAQRAADSAHQAAAQAEAQSLAGCLAYQLIAEAPVAPGTSAFGLQISVALRIAYHTAGCTPPLTPADPRVAALLPPGVQ